MDELLGDVCDRSSAKFVVVWSHGRGFREQRDFDYDVDGGDEKAPFHVASLLRAIPEGFAEAVLFDSCSMATIEIASLLEGRAKRMVASQFELPNLGLQYGGLPKLLAKTRDPLAILREIQGRSEALFRRIGANAPLVILDLSKLGGIESSFRKAHAAAADVARADYGDYSASVRRGEKDGDLLFLLEQYAFPNDRDREGRSLLVDSLKQALDRGSGSLSFALPSAPSADDDLEAIALRHPELFRTWSEKFPNWAEYARNRSSVPNTPPTSPNLQGASL
jgi:hypothetical protein